MEEQKEKRKRGRPKNTSLNENGILLTPVKKTNKFLDELIIESSKNLNIAPINTLILLIPIKEEDLVHTYFDQLSSRIPLKFDKPIINNTKSLINPFTSSFQYSSASKPQNKITTYSVLNKDIWPKRTNLRCWYCTYQFDSIPCFIPLSYSNIEKKYTGIGWCCSYNCAYAWILANIQEKKWEKISLLYSIFNETNKDSLGKKIIPASPKEFLIDYGGEYTIETFREKSGSQYIKCIAYLPPISIIQYRADERNIYNERQQLYELNNGENKQYKIYRNKPVNNSSFINHFQSGVENK